MKGVSKDTLASVFSEPWLTMRRPRRNRAEEEKALPRVAMKSWMMLGMLPWNSRLPKIPRMVIVNSGFFRIPVTTFFAIFTFDCLPGVAWVFPISMRTKPIGLRRAKETGARR